MAILAVIMSTYNGAQYIKEQIDSILNQSFTDFQLFIRDDGSTDQTPSLIEGMAAADSRIVIIKDSASGNTNLGFGGSFSTAMGYALTHSDCSYFALCDQDDYWEVDKLQAAYDSLNSEPADVPALFSSNYYICDSQLQVKSTFSETDPMDGVTFSNMFFEGVFPGFTMVINRRLAEMAFLNDRASSIYYHDKWASLIALGQNGRIIYSDECLAKYRRHEGAVSSTDLGFLKKLTWRIDKVLNGDFCPRTRDMISYYKELFGDDSDAGIHRFLTVFTTGSIIRKFFYPKRLRRSLSGEIMLRMIILLGKI